MSSLIAKVSSIESSERLHIVKFAHHTKTLCMMSLELPNALDKNSLVKLSFKPTHVVLAKDFSGKLSYENILETTVVSIESGKLLSSVKVEFFDTIIEAIITKKSKEKMALKVGDKVLALIQASELFIVEVLDV